MEKGRNPRVLDIMTPQTVFYIRSHKHSKHLKLLKLVNAGGLGTQSLTHPFIQLHLTLHLIKNLN